MSQTRRLGGHAVTGAALGLVLIGGGLLVQPTLRRTVDDAWISFRYAANLAGGLGLVWDAAPPAVEGYSNLTWTLLVALGLRLGFPLLPWVWGCAWALSAGVVIGAAGAVRAAGGSRAAMIGAALLVATSAALRPWLLTGLETPLMAFLLTLGVWRLAAMSPGRGGGAAVTALVWGLVAVTRPEGALYLLVPAVVWLRGAGGRRAGVLVALALAPLGAQLLYRWLSYGTWVTNTGVAKIAWAQDPARIEGWRFLLAAATYDPLQALLWGIGIVLALRGRAGMALLPMVPAAAFVLVANGDSFGELRLLAPVVPCLSVGVIVALDRWLRGATRWRVPLVAATVLLVGAVAAREAWLIRVERVQPEAGPSRRDATLYARLAPPWTTVRTRGEAGEGQRDLLRWSNASLAEIDWFVRLLIERLPLHGTFVFEDIGLVGYLLRDARLLDARGLTWPEAARVVNLAFTPGLVLADRADVRAFREAVHSEDPALVVLACPESEGRTRMQELLLGDPAFAVRWSLSARGPYFSGREQVCVYTRLGLVDADAAVGVGRYEQLSLDLPGYYDWDALGVALASGVADDPAEAWRVGADGALLAPRVEGRGRKRGAPGQGVFNAPGTGEAERRRRRQARGLPE